MVIGELVSKGLAKAKVAIQNRPLLEPILILNFGAEGRTRTADTYIFSVVLYRLSYLGAHRILARPNVGGQGGVVA